MFLNDHLISVDISIHVSVILVRCQVGTSNRALKRALFFVPVSNQGRRYSPKRVCFHTVLSLWLCQVVCGLLVPSVEIKHALPALAACGVLTIGLPGKSLMQFLKHVVPFGQSQVVCHCLEFYNFFVTKKVPRSTGL